MSKRFGWFRSDCTALQYVYLYNLLWRRKKQWPGYGKMEGRKEMPFLPSLIATIALVLLWDMFTVQTSGWMDREWAGGNYVG